MDSVKFVTTLQSCVAEFKKQIFECDTDETMAHYFNPRLKKFLKDHEKEFDVLSAMSFERNFVKFCKYYLLK